MAEPERSSIQRRDGCSMPKGTVLYELRRVDEQSQHGFISKKITAKAVKAENPGLQ